MADAQIVILGKFAHANVALVLRLWRPTADVEAWCELEGSGEDAESTEDVGSSPMEDIGSLVCQTESVSEGARCKSGMW